MLENCLWDVYKPDIWICLSCRFVEYHGEGGSLEFVHSMGMEEGGGGGVVGCLEDG